MLVVVVVVPPGVVEVVVVHCTGLTTFLPQYVHVHSPLNVPQYCGGAQAHGAGVVLVVVVVVPPGAGVVATGVVEVGHAQGAMVVVVVAPGAGVVLVVLVVDVVVAVAHPSIAFVQALVELFQVYLQLPLQPGTGSLGPRVVVGLPRVSAQMPHCATTTSVSHACPLSIGRA